MEPEQFQTLMAAVNELRLWAEVIAIATTWQVAQHLVTNVKRSLKERNFW